MMIVSTFLYNSLLLPIALIDPFALSEPRQEILQPPISSRVQTSLSTWLEVPKRMVAAIVKLDRPILQYGRVARLDGGDTMIAREIVRESEDTRDASYVKVSSFFVYSTDEN